MVRLLRDTGPLGGSLAAVVLVAAWVATWRPQLDPDAWWHIAIGASIADTGRVPTTEPFSWLTAGDPFVAHSWLWDVFLAGAWQVGGATGTSLLALPLTALVVWLLWQLIGIAAPSVPPLGRALLVLAAVIVTLPTWAPRAQTLDVVFVLAIVLVLTRYLHLDARRGLVALPLIGLLWANLHGSAILALPACVAIAVVAAPLGARWGAWPRRPLGPILLAGLGGIAAMLLNPYGPSLLAYPFDRGVASAFTPVIVEWRSPDFGAIELLPFRLLLAGLLLAAVWLPARSRDPYLLLTAAAWTFAALGSVRFLSIAGPLLVVALSPAVGASVAGWFGRVAPSGRGRRRDRRPRAGRGRPHGTRAGTGDRRGRDHRDPGRGLAHHRPAATGRRHRATAARRRRGRARCGRLRRSPATGLQLGGLRDLDERPRGWCVRQFSRAPGRRPGGGREWWGPIRERGSIATTSGPC